MMTIVFLYFLFLQLYFFEIFDKTCIMYSGKRSKLSNLTEVKIWKIN